MGRAKPVGGTGLLRLAGSTFAETNLADCRIDPAAGFGGLIDLLKPRAIAGGANNLSHFTRLFHNHQSLKQNKKLNYWQDNGSSWRRNTTPLLT